MSSTLFNISNDYLKLAYQQDVTVSRPGSSFYTVTSTPILYTNTGYTPMIKGLFQNIDGTWYTCPIIISGPNLANDLPYVAVVYTDGSNIKIGTFGRNTDATTYTITVRLFVFINSVAEVT